MATVDGITVAAADVIDKKHIAAMSVVGGDLVLTRENLATLSTPLPAGGGGGPLSMVQLTSPVVYQTHSSTDSTAYFDQWEEAALVGDVLGIDSPADSNSWSYAEAGWYQIMFKLWCGFTAGATALPPMVMLQMFTWEGMGFSHEVPCSAGPGTWANRSQWGAQAIFTTEVYHDPGAAVASAIDGANNIGLHWFGDAVLKTGNGADPINNALSMIITRVA